MPKVIASRAPFFRPLAAGAPVVAPSILRCLRSQLTGRRSVLCFRLAACQELPRVFPLAPALLVAYAGLALAFVLAIR